MRRKTSKKGILKYTAFVPQTVRATKSAGKAVVKKINYFLTLSGKKIRNTRKGLDRRMSRAISSFTRRKIRR